MTHFLCIVYFANYFLPMLAMIGLYIYVRKTTGVVLESIRLHYTALRDQNIALEEEIKSLKKQFTCDVFTIDLNDKEAVTEIKAKGNRRV